MRYSYVAFAVMGLFISVDLLGFDNDSINPTEGIEKRSVNVSPALLIGNEVGVSGRIEYEKSSLGKLFFTGSAGLLFHSDAYIMLDLGLGYGYPIKNTKQNSLYLNSQLSAMMLSQPIGISTSYNGPAALLEAEYRKKWNNFSFSLSPYVRGILLFHHTVFSDDISTKVLVDFGIRLGCAYNFML